MEWDAARAEKLMVAGGWLAGVYGWAGYEGQTEAVTGPEILDNIYQWCAEEDWEMVDITLAHVVPEQLQPDQVLAFMLASYPYREHFPHRAVFWGEAVKFMVKRIGEGPARLLTEHLL